VNSNYFTSRNMRQIGMARDFASELHQLVGRVTILEDFTLAEVTALGDYMPVYVADAGTQLITEGDTGDFMLILLEGTVDVTRRDRAGKPSRIAVVQLGYALGEMSMIDGEPRFSSCTVLEPARFAVLTRASLTEMIHRHATLGAKILVKLVHMLAQRLRNTSMKLVSESEARRALIESHDRA
jgi:CRP-like cAMP-binding protein